MPVTYRPSTKRPAGRKTQSFASGWKNEPVVYALQQIGAAARRMEHLAGGGIHLYLPP
jgi:hypothetical protein